ncbi:hypothetical protein MRX96_013270 [Rhipicephalus microplus]
MSAGTLAATRRARRWRPTTVFSGEAQRSPPRAAFRNKDWTEQLAVWSCLPWTEGAGLLLLLARPRSLPEEPLHERRTEPRDYASSPPASSTTTHHV